MNSAKRFTEALDITKVVLPMKPRILKGFDKLQGGESMIITNEHDPFILYYQLLEDRGKIFRWEYLERSPTKWRVKITKNPSYNTNRMLIKFFKLL